ncbi:hypothetical protein [Mucilaginibacter sp.]|uniref:hypothetical protein n=1 Tax=Mucilaginibacter sp. TaxID=1882438 RepID=UPI000CAAE861|nr:hypothetical protein [Mucilaginibacter sp.]PLW90001.1 MAG: hypothetical protein C0154_08740 [Mucilaginibacter sp.]PMP65795.1 MAG: hypothetical protein C0191_02730 [Mucilaginibacter sp.]
MDKEKQYTGYVDPGKAYSWQDVKIYLDGQEVKGNYTVNAVAFPKEIDLKTIEFDEEFIKETITNYFKGFFDDMRMVFGEVEGWPAFGFIGKRGGNEFCYSFDVRKFDAEKKDGMLYHWLESIMGEIVKSEKTILLEKK